MRKHDPQREAELKTHNEVYLGTLAGTDAERSELAKALSQLYASITASMGRKGVYAEVNFTAEFADGKLKIASTGSNNSYRVTKSSGE